MHILAIDLDKFKSVACDFDTPSQTHTFTTLATRPQPLHDLIATRRPHRVVIETGNQAGWVKDLCEALNVPIEVANPNASKSRQAPDPPTPHLCMAMAKGLPVLLISCCGTVKNKEKRQCPTI